MGREPGAGAAATAMRLKDFKGYWMLGTNAVCRCIGLNQRKVGEMFLAAAQTVVNESFLCNKVANRCSNRFQCVTQLATFPFFHFQEPSKAFSSSRPFLPPWQQVSRVQ